MEGKKLYNIIYNSNSKYICVESTKIIDILQQAALKFNISAKHYDLRLYSCENIELNQEIFEILLTDMKLTYEKSFILKPFQNYELYKDVAIQTESVETFYEATPVFRQNAFVGSLPKKIKLEKHVLKEELERYLSEHPEAKLILEHYNTSETLPKRLRIKLVNIIVAHLIEVHGTYPSSENKVLWAQATALIFSKLCENKNPELYEIFYNHADRGGFFGCRLKTINRSLKNTSRISKNIPIPQECLSPSEEEKEVKDYSEDIEWLKQACPKNSTPEIFLRMRKTIKCRPTIFTLDLFPRFLDTPGLIDQDFEIAYGEPSFLTNWTEIKTKIIEIGKQRKITIYDECTQNYEKFDDDIFALLILKKLCRNYKRKNQTTTYPKPYSFYVFEKTGTTKDDNINQPHLILRGPTKSEIHFYSILIDEKEIPLTTDSSIKAFATLFKSYYVFNCQYPSDHESFFLFLQEALFKMNKVPLTPRLKELRNMLGC